MANSFGTIFTITTWGESHGPAVGVVIDGCPAGLPLSEEDLRPALRARAPGRQSHTSSRREPDEPKILSGVFEGTTTGSPICIMVANADADSASYEPMRDVLRPGHAQYTYLQKYGMVDHRGGGRASARETVCRVAAGAVARKLLQSIGVAITAYLVDAPTEEALCEVEREGDSIGGIVEFCAQGLPSGLGDPVYEKIEARLASALMGIPGSKGFEIGSGFASAAMRGSEHNDRFVNDNGTIRTATNHAGGVLGGITTGMPLVGRVAFKPASGIAKPQDTVTSSGAPAKLTMQKSRHDPCIAIRAVPVVEAMVALVLVDAYLMNRCAKV